jgi:hypothetical protein
MSMKKYSEYISVHEQKAKTIGLRSMAESASYTYDDDKAPQGADLTSGRGGDINHKAVAAHLKSMGVPAAHAKAISAHLKKDDMDMAASTKLKHGVMSKHGDLTVHSFSDPDSGKTKIRVEG